MTSPHVFFAIDLTGAGLVVRDAGGHQVAAVTFVHGEGEGALLIQLRSEIVEVPLALPAMAHVAAVTREAHVNSAMAAPRHLGVPDEDPSEPLVPRRFDGHGGHLPRSPPAG